MKVLIIEDESPAAIRLQQMIESIDPQLVIDGVAGSVIEAQEYLANNRPDLIFSDIELSDGNCFSIFQNWKEIVPVIFTTAYHQYAIRSFEAHAIDYLLKPIKKAQLAAAIEKSRSRMGLALPERDFQTISNEIRSEQVPDEKRILVRFGGKMVLISLPEIAYFFSESRASFLRTFEGKTFALDESLNQMEETIGNGQFFRINRNLIVQFSSIESMETVSKSRLKLQLTPPPDSDEYSVVSAERSPSFRRWIAEFSKTK